MQYTQEELNKILEKHKRWLRGEPDGEKADLRWVNLIGGRVRLVHLGERFQR